MRIAHRGGSLLKEEYELNVTSKKVYFITFSMSYLHIKGGKYRTRVKFNRTKREKIFNLVNQLIWTNFQQRDDKEIKDDYFVVKQEDYFVIETLDSDSLINSFKVTNELLPPDFKELFDMLSKK